MQAEISTWDQVIKASPLGGEVYAGGVWPVLTTLHPAPSPQPPAQCLEHSSCSAR